MDNGAGKGQNRRKLRRRWAGPWRLVAFAVVYSIVLFAALVIQFLPSRYSLNPGEVSPYDVKSPVKVTYVSRIQTDQERQRASASVPDMYKPIPDVATTATTRANAALDHISQIRRDNSPTADQITQITDLKSAAINSDIATDIVGFDAIQWGHVVTDTVQLTGRLMRTRILPSQVEDVRAAIPEQLPPGLDAQQARVVTALVRDFVEPTMQVDAAATAAARQQAADAVPPVKVTIEKGETILRNGDIVTAGDLERLQAVGLRNPTVRWSSVLALALLVLALTAFLAIYVQLFQPSVASSPRRLLLLGVLLVVSIVAAKFTIPGRELYSFLFPSAAVPMLLAILLDTELGLVATAVLAVLMGLATNGGLEMTAATLVAGGLGALAVHRLERINVLSLAAGAVALGNFVVVVAFQLLNSEVDPQQLALYGFLSLVSGVLSAVLTLGTVSFLGHIFGIATTMNLLELAHPSQPLFRRLLTEAPGTYHHSVVVANLSERAAAAIGADTLLVRIGGYYHDIGKLTRPYAFVENQMDGHNIHDDLDPYTSARFILAHVTDGLELATKYGIPTRIHDLIAQHHGTMLVQYFYRKASEGADQPVDESAFRYIGPRPQSREAAIMMLADGVEAAVRANRDHSSENIATIVDNIFRERIAGGQLDECELTLSDLHKIRAAFLTVLQSIFHPRIEYPAAISGPTMAVAGDR